ncbi:MAG: hypothetical protein ABI778_10235 [Ignavibacteriota bacterium]
MKSAITLFSCLLLLTLCGISPLRAQQPVIPEPLQAEPPNPPPLGGPEVKGLHIPPPPVLMSSIASLRFGAQASGVESCLQVTITNVSQAAQTLTKIYTTDESHYTIPSPSHEMLPINLQPHSSLTLSVCFKPDKPGDYKTHLAINTPADSVILPVEGRGIKTEDVAKLPKVDFTVTKVKKKAHEWMMKYVLTQQSKITIQIFDDLGRLEDTFLNGAFKNEGTYELGFDETDKSRKQLAPGKYFIRCQIEEMARAGQPLKFTKEIEIK